MRRSWRQIVTGGVGLIVAVAMAGVLVGMQGYDPVEALTALAGGALGGTGAISTTLRNGSILVLTGLGASIAFASGAINLGGPGQLLFGAMSATLVGISVDLPAIVMIPLLLVVAAVAGAGLSGFAGWLRVRFGMTEFISTLMLNLIVEQALLWVVNRPLKEEGASFPQTVPIAETGELGRIGGISTAVIVMALVFAITYVIYQRSLVGYEWRITGKNSLFARIGGVEVEANFMRIMYHSGALAGLAGGILVMANTHRFTQGIGANYAWDGVMVAVVAASGLIATVFYGLFFAALQTGGVGMEVVSAVPSELTQVLQATIVMLVVAAREVFVIVLRRRDARSQLRATLDGAPT